MENKILHNANLFEKIKTMAKKKQKEKIDWRIVCVALVCLTILECLALYLGYNGLLFTLVVGIIATAIGVVIPNPFKK